MVGDSMVYLKKKSLTELLLHRGPRSADSLDLKILSFFSTKHKFSAGPK